MPNETGGTTPRRDRNRNRNRAGGTTGQKPAGSASAGASRGGTAVMEPTAAAEQALQQDALKIGNVFSLDQQGTANIYLGQQLGGTTIRQVVIHGR